MWPSLNDYVTGRVGRDIQRRTVCCCCCCCRQVWRLFGVWVDMGVECTVISVSCKYRFDEKIQENSVAAN